MRDLQFGVSLTPNAMLAKAAASLDLLSGGRFELGVGAGASQPAVAAIGGPGRKPRRRPGGHRRWRS